MANNTTGEGVCGPYLTDTEAPLWKLGCRLAMSVVLVAESGITIYINWHSHRMRQRTSTKLVTNLAVSGGLTGLLVIVFTMLKLMGMSERRVREYRLMVIVIAPRFLHIISVMCLVCLALDRYLAICWPMRYHNLMTEYRCRLLVAGSWLVTATVMVGVSVFVRVYSGCTRFLSDPFPLITAYLLLFTLASFAVVVMYGLMAREFWRGRGLVPQVTKAMKKDYRRVKEKTARDVLVIVLLNLLFALPDVIVKLLWLVDKDTRAKTDHITPLLLLFHQLFFLPLFAWRTADFNTALLACCASIKNCILRELNAPHPPCQSNKTHNTPVTCQSSNFILQEKEPTTPATNQPKKSSSATSEHLEKPTSVSGVERQILKQKDIDKA